MDKIRQWIIEQQDTLDRLISAACLQFIKDQQKNQNKHFEFRQCLREAYGLSQGEDLCYDREFTPLAYTIWYHPRRINTFLSYFLDHLLNLNTKLITLYDLGAGTGAIQWALALGWLALKKNNIPVPDIKVINVDSSPFMLAFNKDYLWEQFSREYNLSHQDIEVVYKVNSWQNELDLVPSHTIIASSYMFDASDQTDELLEDFRDFVATHEPETLLFLTSYRKAQKLQQVERAFGEKGYLIQSGWNKSFVLSGPLNTLSKLRWKLAQKLDGEPLLKKEVCWDEQSHMGLVAKKQVMKLLFEGTRPIKKIELYNPPIRVVDSISLNSKQMSAARHTDTPSVIIGPAGCGKSIVIAYKIVDAVKKARGQNDALLRILVSSFNKAVITQLAQWVYRLLKSEYQIQNANGEVKELSAKSGYYSLIVDAHRKVQITFIHFDKMPGTFVNVNSHGVNTRINYKLMGDAIDFATAALKIEPGEHTDVLDIDFLMEEHRRVIYGLEVDIQNTEEYLNVARTGRGNRPSLPKEGPRRKLVLQVLRQFEKLLDQNGLTTFPLRRRCLIEKLNTFTHNKKFDFLYVDEFQDCTPADFKIFDLLLRDPDHLCIAGDLAQSVHLGTSARIPRFRDMARRKIHRLEGSYRLPVRVSEAIKPISEAINLTFSGEEGVGIITPYKGSPPGARPIVVYGATDTEVAEKIRDIYNSYNCYGIDIVTILEKDSNLTHHIKSQGIKAETDTILRLKGLEKKCIIWSVRAGIENPREVYEMVYTILSRTAAILIICLLDDIKEYYKPVIGKLNKSRLILWDQETEDCFDDFCEQAEIFALEDD